MLSTNKGGSLLLRAGVAFAFLYPALNSFIHPDAWIGFFPRFMLGHVPDSLMLTAWGILEVAIAAWILSGKKIFIPTFVAASLLLLVVAFNFPLIDILFRDLALAMAAGSLAWTSYHEV